jgi:hypothetical protein
MPSIFPHCRAIRSILHPSGIGRLMRIRDFPSARSLRISTFESPRGKRYFPTFIVFVSPRIRPARLSVHRTRSTPEDSSESRTVLNEAPRGTMTVRSEENEVVFEAKKMKYTVPTTTATQTTATACSHLRLKYSDIVGCAARGSPFRFLFLIVHIHPLDAAGFVDDSFKQPPHCCG